MRRVRRVPRPIARGVTTRFGEGLKVRREVGAGEGRGEGRIQVYQE